MGFNFRKMCAVLSIVDVLFSCVCVAVVKIEGTIYYISVLYIYIYIVLLYSIGSSLRLVQVT